MRKDQPRDSHGRFVKVQPKVDDLIIQVNSDLVYPGFFTWYSETTTTDPDLLDNGMSLIRKLEAERGFTIRIEQPVSEIDTRISVDNSQAGADKPDDDWSHAKQKSEVGGYIAAALLGVIAGLAFAGITFEIMRLCR